jgi:putative oxidoreductase
MQRFFATDTDRVRLFQRIVLAAVIFPHGAQKLFGWFGGHGFDGTMAFMTQQGIPAPLAFLVIIGESFGAVALAFGLFTRLTAFGIAAIMIGAVAMVHWPVGFWMNWTGTQAGEGFEYHLLALALAIPLVIKGGGLGAIDRAIARAIVRRHTYARG